MFLNILISSILGTLSGLGIGGGSLLLLYLTAAMGMDQQTARGINLLFFLPAAIIACCIRLRKGILPLKKLMPAIVSGSIAAGLFAWIGSGTDTQMLRKAFGLLLIFTGIRELRFKDKRPEEK